MDPVIIIINMEVVRKGLTIPCGILSKIMKARAENLRDYQDRPDKMALRGSPRLSISWNRTNMLLCKDNKRKGERQIFVQLLPKRQVAVNISADSGQKKDGQANSTTRAAKVGQWNEDHTRWQDMGMTHRQTGEAVIIGKPIK